MKKLSPYYSLMKITLFFSFQRNIFFSPRALLVEVLMITNQGYWLLMVKIELSDR